MIFLNYMFGLDKSMIFFKIKRKTLIHRESVQWKPKLIFIVTQNLNQLALLPLFNISPCMLFLVFLEESSTFYWVEGMTYMNTRYRI